MFYWVYVFCLFLSSLNKTAIAMRPVLNSDKAKQLKQALDTIKTIPGVSLTVTSPEPGPPQPPRLLSAL